MSVSSSILRQFFRLGSFPSSNSTSAVAAVTLRGMASSSGSDKLVVEHDKLGKNFFIKLGEAEAKLEYAEGKGKAGNVVLNMWHTEVPPQLQGRGVAKVLAKEAFDYVAENKLKMQLTCTYLQKYYKDNPLDKYKEAVV